MTNTCKTNRLADMLLTKAQVLLSNKKSYQPLYIKRNFDFSWRVYLGEPEEDLFCEPLYLSQENSIELKEDKLKNEVYRAVQAITDRINTDLLSITANSIE